MLFNLFIKLEIRMEMAKLADNTKLFRIYAFTKLLAASAMFGNMNDNHEVLYRQTPQSSKGNIHAQSHLTGSTANTINAVNPINVAKLTQVPFNQLHESLGGQWGSSFRTACNK